MPNPPQIIKRKLTFTFLQSVSAEGVPDVMEVVVTPLSSPSNPNVGASFVGGPQKKKIELSDPTNQVVFELVRRTFRA